MMAILRQLLAAMLSFAIAAPMSASPSTYSCSPPTTLRADNLYRVTSENIPCGTGTPACASENINCTYDAVGNRKQLTSTPTAVPAGLWNYNANDQLTTDTVACPERSRRDANGNTTAAGGLGFTNRVAHATEPQSSNTSTSERTFRFDTPKVKLEGTLSERVFYGPPGFGETPDKDARERVLILTLRQPITVVPAENAKPKVTSSLSTLSNVRAVQLFIFPPAKREQARKLIGKTVVAIGTLNEATAPSEHLKVTMDVEALNPE
jgi:hypothetical protein